MKNTHMVIGNRFEVVYAQVTFQSLAYLMTFMQTAYSAQPSSAEDALAFRRLLVSPPHIVNLQLKFTKKSCGHVFLWRTWNCFFTACCQFWLSMAFMKAVPQWACKLTSFVNTLQMHHLGFKIYRDLSFSRRIACFSLLTSNSEYHRKNANESLTSTVLH